jgi:hypothetical protein
MKVLNAVFGAVAVIGVLAAVGCGEKKFKAKSDPETPAAASPKPNADQSSNNGQTNSPAPIAPPQVTQTSSNQQGGGSGGSSWTPASLAQACSSQSLKTETVILQIASNDGYRCEFGKNGNLVAKSATLAARLEHNIAIPGTQGRILCSMNAESGTQVIRYDDQLFLSINNNLIVSSSAAVSQLDKAANGFRQYNWDKVRGASTGASKFCADGVSCNLPKSESTGNFNFSISQEANNRLFSSIAGQQLSVGLVITGDNDIALDCQLDTGMNLKFTYTYIGQ